MLIFLCMSLMDNCVGAEVEKSTFSLVLFAVLSVLPCLREAICQKLNTERLTDQLRSRLVESAGLFRYCFVIFPVVWGKTFV